MRSPFSGILPLRLRRTSGRILCSLPLPRADCDSESYLRELVVVASPTPPRLRHLTVYRRLPASAEGPGYPPQAA